MTVVVAWNMARFWMIVSEMIMKVWTRVYIDVASRLVTIIEWLAWIRPVDYVAVCCARHGKKHHQGK